LVLGGAHITIAAGSRVIVVQAPHGRLAGIISARVAIVTVDFLARGTEPFCTDIAQSALVAIRAQPTFIGRREGAQAGGRIANGILARRVNALRFRAYHHRIGVEHALERNLLVVTDQLARTQVLFERCAVCILQAIA